MKNLFKIFLIIFVVLTLTAQTTSTVPRLSRNGNYTVYGTSGKCFYLDEFNQKKPVQCLQQLRGYDYVIIGRSAGHSPLDRGERGAMIVQYKRVKYVIGTSRDEDGTYTSLEGEVYDLIKDYGILQ